MSRSGPIVLCVWGVPHAPNYPVQNICWCFQYSCVGLEPPVCSVSAWRKRRLCGPCPAGESSFIDSRMCSGFPVPPRPPIEEIKL